MKLLLGSCFVGAACGLADPLATFFGMDGAFSNAEKVSGGNPSQFFKAHMASVKKAADEYVAATPDSLERAEVRASDYPYYAFIPPLQVSLVPGEPAQTWKSSCFGTSSAVATMVGDAVQIDFTFENKKLLCTNELYLVGTMAHLQFLDQSDVGEHTMSFHLANPLDKISDAERFDIMTNGVRIFKFNEGRLKAIEQLITTAELFIGDGVSPIPQAATDANVDFLQKYNGHSYAKRTLGATIPKESEIKSGDGLFITRMDGLDPMLSWATGGSGHSTIAMWEDDQLFVYESQVAGAYWPYDNVQKTPYSEWMDLAQQADYNVVLTPLNEQYAAQFDEAKALEWFKSVEGYSYGFYNFLMGWVDTTKNNYPCVPPYPSQTCLEWDHLMVLFGNIDHWAPSVTEQILGQALGQRVGNRALRLADIMQLWISSNGKENADQIITVVEQDSWIYNTTRNGKPTTGPSMVCSVFVCAMWKNAGVFGDIADTINCGEFVPFDDTALKIFENDVSKLPSVCSDIDPSQPCQIMGANNLPVVQYNTIDLYKHFAETCDSMAPDYKRVFGC